MRSRTCLYVLTAALLLNVVETFAPAPVRAAEPLQSGWEAVPRLLAQGLGADPQGSIGKWPGGYKAPNLVVTVVVLLLLAGAVIGFILYARKQKQDEQRAAEKLRCNRSRDGG